MDEATRIFNAEALPALMRRIKAVKFSEKRLTVLRNVVDTHIAMRPAIPERMPGFTEVEWKMLDNWHHDAWKALVKADEDLNKQKEVVHARFCLRGSLLVQRKIQPLLVRERD
jgi:hypothetical protein